MSVHDDPFAAARRALADRQPEAALDALLHLDDPESHWLRALAAALIGDALRASIALRAARRAGALPPQALLDIAQPFARAVLDEQPAARSLAPLALAVHDELGEVAPVDPVHLAWELAVRAAVMMEDQTASDVGPGMVLTLGALKWRMGRAEEATALLRGAQQAGVATHDAESVHGAALILAEIALSRDDPALAEAVIQHAGRQLARLGGDAGALRQAWAAVLSSRAEAASA